MKENTQEQQLKLLSVLRSTTEVGGIRCEQLQKRL